MPPTSTPSSASSPSLPCGIKVLIGFIIFQTLILVTQTWSVFDYDKVASLKLQEPRIFADEAVVQSNRAIGLAETIIMLPLSAMSIIGLLQRKFYGVICSWMLLGITLYWPVVFVMSRFTYASADIRHIPLRAEDLILVGIIFLFACWGSWYLCRLPELLDWWENDFPNRRHRQSDESSLLGERKPLVDASASP